jgi:hypothetical protein
VKLYRDGGKVWLLDGVNRLDALELNGDTQAIADDVELVLTGGEQRTFELVRCIEPYAYCISANLHRRHLTQQQKRDLIAKLLKANPERSDRQMAGLAKVDNKTVGTIRREMEAREEIPHVEKRTDTKGRHQPATKPQAAASAAPLANAPLPPAEGREDQFRKIAAQTVESPAAVLGAANPRRDAKLIAEHYGHDGLKLRELASALDWWASRAFGRAARAEKLARDHPTTDATAIPSS